MARWIAPLAALGLALAPASARANADVDEGERRYAEADFEGALAAFERAEDAEALSRGELIRLLEGRALAEYALEDLDAARVTVRRLASVAPEHRMGEVVPPELVRMFEAAAETLGAGITLRIDPAWSGSRVTLTPVLGGDVAGLVRGLTIAGRPEGGAWEEAGAEGLTLEVPEGALEAHAAALGPGGAILARAGEPGAPRRLERPAADEGGVPAWGWGLIAGGAALIAVAVIVGVAVAASAGDVQIAPPRLLPSGS